MAAWLPVNRVFRDPATRNSAPTLASPVVRGQRSESTPEDRKMIPRAPLPPSPYCQHLHTLAEGLGMC